MTKLFLEGQEKTHSDWYLSSQPGGELRLTIIYALGRSYSLPYDEVLDKAVIQR